MYKIGAIQKKILVALLGGVALGFSRSPIQYFKTLRKIKKDWEEIDQRSFNRSYRSLSQEKLIEEQRMSDGSFKLKLTKEGEKHAKTFGIIGSSISFKKSVKWDGLWRIVMFDIPEKDRTFRDILRAHLRTLEFFRLQQSVFVSPHPFEKSILELVGLYEAERYVRVITANKIDNESNLKKHFFKDSKK